MLVAHTNLKKIVLRGGSPWGLEIDSKPAQQPHVIKVYPSSPAEDHLFAGDKLLDVNGVSVSDRETAEQMISNAFTTLTLTIWRSNLTSKKGLEKELSPSVPKQEQYHSMATIKRTESDKRIPRSRPLTVFTHSGSDHSKPDPPHLQHARSTDALNVVKQSYVSSHPSELRVQRGESTRHLNTASTSDTLSTGLGSKHRSMSHRDLYQKRGRSSDGIMDAFHFAAGTLDRHTSHRSHIPDSHFERFTSSATEAPEMPPPPINYPPSPQRDDSILYKYPQQQQQQLWTTVNNSHASSQHQQLRPENNVRNDTVKNHTQTDTSQQPKPRSSFGPLIKKSDSVHVKKRMQRGRMYNDQQSASADQSGEVVSEKGRSVKSIIGIFDKPAIEEALSLASRKPFYSTYAQTAQQSQRAQLKLPTTEEKDEDTVEQTNAADQGSKVRSADRKETQVVHIAKFVQIDTPSKPMRPMYSDAQTSPMQLSPVVPTSPIIAKAELFNGTPRLKVATLTSSTSSYHSAEVFTPCEDVDIPVFDPRDDATDLSSSHHGHQDSSSDWQSDSYDIAPTASIPGHCYPPQQLNGHDFIRQHSVDENQSNLYEDVELPKTPKSIESEPIYEPISPMKNNNNYVNMANLHDLSPSNEYVDMRGCLQELKSDAQAEENQLYKSTSERPRSLSSERTLNGLQEGDKSDIHDRTYSNKVRKASAYALRQTSVETSRRSVETNMAATRDEHMNLCNTQRNQYMSGSNITSIHTRAGSQPSPRIRENISHYNSDASINSQEKFSKSSAATRTESYRQENAPRRQVRRAGSYRERPASMDSRESKAEIRDQLLNFVKRKKGETGDNLEGLINEKMLQKSPNNMHDTLLSNTSRHVQRNQSDRSTKPHPLDIPKTRSNLNRVTSFTSQRINRRSLDLNREHNELSSPSSPNHRDQMFRHNSESVFIQSREGSVSSQRITSSSSSDRSPISPLTHNNSPRVKKPLIAEVSPFSMMPGTRHMKERSQRRDTNSSCSSIGSSVKPMKVPQPTDQEIPPSLPPRNYKLDEENALRNYENMHHGPPVTRTEEKDIRKQYENVFNGRKGSDESFDADYTKQLRRVSEVAYPKRTSMGSPKSQQSASNPQTTQEKDSNKQVLETDIDETSTEVQPVPPPRRSSKREEEFTPPPKPPKLYNTEINHNYSSSSRVNGQYNVQPKKQNSKLHNDSAVTPTMVDMSIKSFDPAAHEVKPVRRSTSFGKKERSESKRESLDVKPSISTRLTRTNLDNDVLPQHSDDVPPRPLDRQTQHTKQADSNSRRQKPKPFNRYGGDAHLTSNDSSVHTANHSKQVSGELADIHQKSASVAETKSPSPSSRSPVSTKSPTPASRSVHSRSSTPGSTTPVRNSPTPAKRTTSGRSSADSAKVSATSSLSDKGSSKSSTPAHSPIDKSFRPISEEILANLTNKGIDITEKHKCISDESKVRMKRECLNANADTSPTSSRAKLSVSHIRQKSSDELLCDHQVEHLGRSIKNASLSQVLSQPEKGTKDYLPGLFDDVLTKEMPRRQRVSMDGTSPCHSKQTSSECETLAQSPSCFDELNSVEEKKEELILVLRKKLQVLKQDQEFVQQETGDNDRNGMMICKLVEEKCTEREVKKYKSYIEDVEKVTKLLLKLSRRLARAENELLNAPMDSTDDDKKSLEQRRDNLLVQHNDAKMLKEAIDRRKNQVGCFLERSLDKTQYSAYDNYISMKLRMIVEMNDIDDQIMHCEEQVEAVTAISDS